MSEEWRWRVEGMEASNSPGATRRSFEDGGEIEAESSGDALAALLHTGPFWGVLDSFEAVTITLEPARG